MPSLFHQNTVLNTFFLQIYNLQVGAGSITHIPRIEIGTSFFSILVIFRVSFAVYFLVSPLWCFDACVHQNHLKI